MKSLFVSSSSSSRQGFTLVEVLTAMTVLTFLSVMLMQMISVAIAGTGTTLRRADSVGQLRLVLDRFGNDWDNRVRRTDAPFSVYKNVGNDAVSFYSMVNGFSGTSIRPQVSQVDYLVDAGNATTSPFLKRGALNTSWSPANPLQLGAPSLTMISTPADYQSISDDICRFETCFLLKSTGQISAAAPANFADVGAIIVSIASLDAATRSKLSVNAINTLVTKLVDATDGMSATPADQWNAYLASATNQPALVLQNIRINQRVYYTR